MIITCIISKYTSILQGRLGRTRRLGKSKFVDIAVCISFFNTGLQQLDNQAGLAWLSDEQETTNNLA
jgi:hypothetical protein